MKPLRNTTIYLTSLFLLFVASCKKEQSATPVNAPTYGPGPNGEVNSSVVCNGNLVISGTFDGIYTLYLPYIAQWNGTKWSGFPASNPATIGGIPWSIGVYNNELLAYAEWSIHQFNGNTWQNFGGQFSQNDYGYGFLGDVGINAMETYNGNLVAGGVFHSINNIPLNDIALWNGSSWSALGKGVHDYFSGVSALTVYNGNLIVAGLFDSAGGVAANNIAQWNGSTWSTLGSGITSSEITKGVSALTVFNGNLVVGGMFDHAGGWPAKNIAIWNGSNWANMDTGVAIYVQALAVYNNNLVAAGWTSSNSPTCMFQWNGSNWTNPFGGFTNPSSGSRMTVNTLTLYNGNLVVGGCFEEVDNVNAFNLAQWNGSSWSSF